MKFRSWSMCVVLVIVFAQAMLYGAVYELRNGSVEVKPGTESMVETNITIDSLMEILLAYQTRFNDMDEKLRKRDQQLFKLQDEVKAVSQELTLLKNHYFRQF